jgi:hypothetical protein
MPDFDIYISPTPGTYIKQGTETGAVDEDAAVTSYAAANNIPEAQRLFATATDAFTEYVITINRTYNADLVV